MSISVNVAELKSIIQLVIRASKEGNRVPLTIHGMHGIGKTEIVGQIAKAAGYNFVPLYLSTQEASDLIGLPDKVEVIDADGNTSKVTVFAKPDWLHEASKHEKTLFFLDEMNRAEPYVLQTMLPFALDGRIHMHRIKDADLIISAMNPDTADYNVTAIEDKALLSRFAHVYFEPKRTEWLQHLTDRGDVHHALIASMSESEKIADHKIVVELTSRVKPEPDRRSLTKIGQLMKIMTDSEVGDIGYKMFSSMVGSDASGVIINAFQNNTLSHEHVLTGSVFKMGINFDKDIDKLSILNEQLVLHVFNNFDDINKKEMKNLTKYMDKLPQDTAIAYIRNLKAMYLADTENGVSRLYKVFDTFDEHLGYEFATKQSSGVLNTSESK
jgi:hypothetical protein